LAIGAIASKLLAIILQDTLARGPSRALAVMRHGRATTTLNAGSLAMLSIGVATTTWELQKSGGLVLSDSIQRQERATLLKRSALIVFYALTFGFAWGIGLAYGVFNAWMVRVFGPVSLGNPLVFFTVWSPTVFALGVAFAFDGMNGLRELIGRIFRWRFGFRWYLISTLGIAVLALGARYLQAAVIKTAAPPVFDFASWPAFAWYGVSMMILDPGPLGEDPGWRGFALPRMLGIFRPAIAAILLGVIWTLWHLPAFLFSGMPQSSLPLQWFIVAMISVTVLMSWATINTGGAVIPAILMHWSFNRFSDLGTQGAIYAATAYFLAAAAVIVATRGSLGLTMRLAQASVSRNRPP
jgi:membrane protease YdiL (CAAX protease family)